MTGWFKIKPAAEYSGVCVRTFRPWLRDGLRHIRLPSGTILIKKQWIDEFLTNFENTENEIDSVVSEVMKEVI
jgi:hypothetical protein